MICPNCKKNLTENIKFCPSCGTKVNTIENKSKKTKTCPVCGTENPLYANFCKVDGYRFDTLESYASDLKTKIEDTNDSKICPKCGTVNSPNAKFCRLDGTPLKKETSAIFTKKTSADFNSKQAGLITKSTQQHKSTSPIVITLTIIIILIFSLLVVHFYYYDLRHLPLLISDMFYTKNQSQKGNINKPDVVLLEETYSMVPNVSTAKGIITGSGVILRKGPSISTSIVDRLNKGDVVTILDKFRVDNTHEAVITSDVDIVTESGLYRLNKGKAVKIIQEYYDTYLISFDITGKENTGQVTKQMVKRTYGQIWYNVKTNKGIEGWVFGDYLMEINQ